jgi:hypothetical protein
MIITMDLKEILKDIPLGGIILRHPLARGKGKLNCKGT